MVELVRLEDLSAFAHRCWAAIGDARVVALHGPMGAGKTTLVSALCAARGVTDAVSSPTFSLINEYRGVHNGREETIYHLDLYRLNSTAEAVQAGVEDCLASGAVCLVEWPERAPGLFEADTVRLQIEPVDAATRRIEVAGPAPAHAESQNNRNL